MKEVLKKLIAEYGLEIKKDPFDDTELGCYNGRVVIYQLSPGLIDVLDEGGSFFSSSSEEVCRERLNEILPILRQRMLDRKLKKMARDFE